MKICIFIQFPQDTQATVENNKTTILSILFVKKNNNLDMSWQLTVLDLNISKLFLKNEIIELKLSEIVYWDEKFHFSCSYKWIIHQSANNTGYSFVNISKYHVNIIGCLLTSISAPGIEKFRYGGFRFLMNWKNLPVFSFSHVT